MMLNLVIIISFPLTLAILYLAVKKYASFLDGARTGRDSDRRIEKIRLKNDRKVSRARSSFFKDPEKVRKPAVKKSRISRKVPADVDIRVKNSKVMHDRTGQINIGTAKPFTVSLKKKHTYG
jgi:hypothetical protein